MDFIALLIGGIIVAYYSAYLLQLLSFGLLSLNTCQFITVGIYVAYVLYFALRIICCIIEQIFSFFGKKIDLDFDRKYREKREFKKERAKINKRVALHNSITKELEEIIKKYQVVDDSTLIEDFVPSNIAYYMTNDEKYEYVIEQEKKVKDMFDKHKHLFTITNEGIYIKDTFSKDEFTFIDTKRNIIAYPYKEEDISFLKKVYPIDAELLDLMVERRNTCYKVIKDTLSQATIEAITTKKGYDGEKNVANFLNLYKDNYIILNNIRVKLDGQSSESDFIIICDKGVFAIEVKNHGNINSTIVISSDGRWSTIKNGRREIKDNVSAQNNRHCAINQTIYNKDLKDNGYDGKYIKCNSIIVIANDKVNIKNESMNVVLRISEIITYIENLQVDTKLPKNIQEEIKNSLLANNLPPKKYPVIDLENNLKEALIEYERTSTNLKGYRELKRAYVKYIK